MRPWESVPAPYNGNGATAAGRAVLAVEGMPGGLCDGRDVGVVVHRIAAQMGGIVVRNLSDRCPICVRFVSDWCPICVRFHKEMRRAARGAPRAWLLSARDGHERLSRPPGPCRGRRAAGVAQTSDVGDQPQVTDERGRAIR
jgi:hypothetical protein